MSRAEFAMVNAAGSPRVYVPKGLKPDAKGKVPVRTMPGKRKRWFLVNLRYLSPRNEAAAAEFKRLRNS